MTQHKEETFTEKLDRIVPDKALMIATLVGVSGVLCEYIHAKHKPDELPPMVAYAMAIIAGNILALVHDHELPPMSKDFSSYRMSEQAQETVIRVMKLVITDLYNTIKAGE